jgi:hypothetical protein
MDESRVPKFRKDPPPFPIEEEEPSGGEGDSDDGIESLN